MRILGKTMIFRNEYEGKSIYSTTISSKDINGNYTNMYVSVQLPKDTELQNKAMIEITKGFLSFYNTKEGLPKIKMVVLEYILDEQENNYEINSDELPF